MSKKKIAAAVVAAVLAGLASYFGLAGDGADPCAACPCSDAEPADASSDSSSGGDSSSDGGSTGE